MASYPTLTPQEIITLLFNSRVDWLSETGTSGFNSILGLLHS